MKNINDENLKELLKKFYDEEHSMEFIHNMEFAEKILSATREPAPSREVIENIKRRISKGNSYKLYWELSAAAAILIIITLSAVNIFRDEPAHYQGTITSTQWESSNFSIDDNEFFAINNSIEDVSEQMLTLSEENNNELANSIVELETDMIDLENNFWKG
jgi:hypothetical protein